MNEKQAKMFMMMLGKRLAVYWTLTKVCLTNSQLEFNGVKEHINMLEGLLLHLLMPDKGFV